MSSSSPPSKHHHHSSSDGGGADKGECPSRSSLARVSMSTALSAEESLSSTSQPPPRPLPPAYLASWETTQSSDIRGDLAMGWGQQPQRNDPRMNSGSNDNYRLRQQNRNDDHEDRMEDDDDDQQQQQDQWGWRLNIRAVRPVPEFYPLDPRSTRRIHLEVVDSTGGEAEKKMISNSIEEISNRISTACQCLSIHGVWDNLCPSTALSSMEQVEMVINMFLSEDDDAVTAYSSSSQQPPPSPRVLLVELQRRKGCSITFHNYRRCLLDAAEGKFDPESFHLTDGLEKPLGRDRCNQPRATLASTSRPGGLLARPSLRPPSYSADDASSGLVIAGLKTEGVVSSSSPDYDEQRKPMAVYEKAMKALNMAASLIHKDRVDARRLGLESLVLLTDPLRAGIETAHIASRVVLLGSAQEEHCGSSSMAMTNDDDVDALFDESSGLGIREKILEMILTDSAEGRGGSPGDSGTDGFEMIEQEFTDCLFNLCLTVLSNALQTMEGKVPSFPKQQHDIIDGEDGEDRKLSPRARASTEPAVRPTAINMMEQQVSKRFIDDTNSTFGCDVLSSLIRILGQAKTNPHDAYHSARCLGVLFKGCGNSHKARARRDLDAKRIIAAALEVGSRSHAKLADASREAMVALVTDDEESMEEEQSPRQGGGERMDLERNP